LANGDRLATPGRRSRAGGAMRTDRRAESGGPNKKRAPPCPEEPFDRERSGTDNYEQPLVVPQLTHLWQLPLGIMIDPHSGQVGASVRAMKL
jgi:hypothetical protein